MFVFLFHGSFQITFWAHVISLLCFSFHLHTTWCWNEVHAKTDFCVLVWFACSCLVCSISFQSALSHCSGSCNAIIVFWAPLSWWWAQHRFLSATIVMMSAACEPKKMKFMLKKGLVEARCFGIGKKGFWWDFYHYHYPNRRHCHHYHHYHYLVSQVGRIKSHLAFTLSWNYHQFFQQSSAQNIIFNANDADPKRFRDILVHCSKLRKRIVSPKWTCKVLTSFANEISHCSSLLIVCLFSDSKCFLGTTQHPHLFFRCVH